MSLNAWWKQSKALQEKGERKLPKEMMLCQLLLLKNRTAYHTPTEANWRQEKVQNHQMKVPRDERSQLKAGESAKSPDESSKRWKFKARSYCGNSLTTWDYLKALTLIIFKQRKRTMLNEPMNLHLHILCLVKTFLQKFFIASLLTFSWQDQLRS